jgi:rubrerythrin
MDQYHRDHLEKQARIAAYAYVRNLAAAEAAVLRGQFNVAKVLRAVAHTQRTQALAATRLLVTDLDPERLFATINAELAASANVVVPDTDPAAAAVVDRLASVAHSAADLVQRAAASLMTQVDVPESVVAQFLWVCYSCGNLTEGDEPEICAVCGARPPEFEAYEPFYSITPEHLGQRSPAEIVATWSRCPIR